MKKLSTALLFLSIIPSTFIAAQSINHWETAVFNNDIWKYSVGKSEPPTDWRSLAFNEAGWTEGTGGFGYSDNDDNTIIPQCYSVYIRKKFSINDTSAISMALLSIDYDDAFVAYLNDMEIARSGITGIHPPFNQTGTDHEATFYSGGKPESFFIYKNQLKQCIRNGDNILAIQVHNSSSASSDMSSNAFLSFGITNTTRNYRPVAAWFAVPFDFSSSDLPVVVITTPPGVTIKNEPKIIADMKIICNDSGKRNFVSDSGNVYTGKVGIEIRGKYSASLPQKPYGFETCDNDGNKLDVSLLGMPDENDWVLLANYNDKTFLRNVLPFGLFEKMGNYSVRTRFCEVVLNNEYQGIYLLGEKIKQDDGRIDIATLKPEDNSGNELTGGYIIKNDYYTTSDSWQSSFSPLNKPGAKVYFVYHDPASADLTAQQKNYIQEYIKSLETVLYGPYFSMPGFGYKSYIDIKSFADYFIIEEVSRNVDAYKKSRYYYKDKDNKGGLLHSGPVWDFDWAWRNLTENCIHMNKTDGSGWAYRINECNASPVPPSWEIRMIQDSAFANLIYTRYSTLRNTILSRKQLEKTIDSVALLLNEAQERHFQRWKILGIAAGTPESDPQPLTYSGEIEKLKSWINKRLVWLDGNMTMLKSYSVYTPEKNVNWRIFPNPSSYSINIQSDKEIKSYNLLNLAGKKLGERSDLCDYSLNLNISHLAPGIYILVVQFGNGEIHSKMIIKQ